MKPCNSSSHKQTRFRGNQIHLPSRHLDVLTVYSSCKLKPRQDERQGIKLPSETIAPFVLASNSVPFIPYNLLGVACGCYRQTSVITYPLQFAIAVCG